jgi:hypothetical protein
MEASRTMPFVQETWRRFVLPALEEYVSIPALSTLFDPNEFLHLPTAMKLSSCVAHVLDAMAGRER